MTLKIRHGNGAFIVIGDGKTVHMVKEGSCYVLKSKLIREENLT